MIRRAAAVVLALSLNPAVLAAQDTVFTVTAPSANVYKGPTTVTPVIGHAPRGTVLPVTRNLGSWAKVPWPDAPDGIGYVHLTMGRLASASGVAAPSADPAPRASDPGAMATPRAPSPAGRIPRDPIVVTDESTGTPISHMLGVGARVASTRNFGATSRVWRNDRVGIQLSFTREAMTSGVSAGRVTSMQVEPGIVYALFDHVSDYVWIRPYVGSGVSFQRQRLNVSSSDAVPIVDNGFGLRVFGGSELTFASAQRFGLSVEVGYRRLPTPFAGFEPHKLSASLAGHWYIK
jgi:hypothetical protein